MEAQVAPLVLASASPRRRELLARLGLRFDAIATDAEERDDRFPSALPDDLPSLAIDRAHHPVLLAWRKAQAAAELQPDALVLAADTIVVLDGAVLNKPRDAAHACAMLAYLSDRVHTVYTGLCMLAGGRRRCELVASQVRFRALTPAEIAAYVASGEPLDKAGAYGLQGAGGTLVTAVEGSYTNVVGLPLVATAALLRAAGLTVAADPAAVYLRWLHDQGKEPLPCPPTFP